MPEYILFQTASNIIANGNYRINPDFHCRRSGLIVSGMFRFYILTPPPATLYSKGDMNYSLTQRTEKPNSGS